MNKKLTFLLLASLVYGSISAKILRFSDSTETHPQIAKSFRNFPIEKESFEFYSPKLISNDEKLGLLIYIAPIDSFQIPGQWKKICKEYRLALIAPRKVGNNQKAARRMIVSVMGTLLALEEGNYDEKRVYLAGFSGGGRIASQIMFHFPNIFNACLGICGFDYNEKIDFSECSKGSTYGYFEYKNSKNENKLKQLKLAVVTGPGDFRHCNLRKIVNNGYLETGYRIKLFDYKGYKHELAGYRELKDVIEYFDR